MDLHVMNVSRDGLARNGWRAKSQCTFDLNLTKVICPKARFYVLIGVRTSFASIVLAKLFTLNFASNINHFSSNLSLQNIIYSKLGLTNAQIVEPATINTYETTTHFFPSISLTKGTNTIRANLLRSTPPTIQN